MRALRGIALSVGLLGVAACGSPFDLPGYPLYARTDARLAHDEVARLYGPIALVDDRDVSALGDALELLPGCHFVRTRDDAVPNIAGRVGRAGGLRFGSQSFVVAMRRGHAYVVKRLATITYMAVTLEEHDASGAWCRDIHPGTSDMPVCESQMLAARRSSTADDP